MKNEFGTLHNVTGRYALQFERSFSKSKEEVFQVLTNAHSFSKWYTFATGEMELKIGGKIHLDDGEGTTYSGIITEIKEPTVSQKELSDIKKNMINGIQFFNKDIAEKFQDHPDEILKWITQVQLSPTPLARAAFCEQVLLNEVNLGLEQYVILGAGYDSFCFRHLELENKLEIFELDHPSTQELKRKRITDAGWKSQIISILFPWISPKISFIKGLKKTDLMRTKKHLLAYIY